MRMQPIVRIRAGETAIVPKLTHMDVSYDVGPDRCSPCRLIRIVGAAAGTIHLELSWEPNPGAALSLWAGGQRVGGDLTARRVVADAALSAGENVVYVGYYQRTVINGSSIAVTHYVCTAPGTNGGNASTMTLCADVICAVVAPAP